MEKCKPGPEAEELKEEILKIHGAMVEEGLRRMFESPPPFLLIYFETVKGDRTHYKTNIQELQKVPDILRKLATVMEAGLMKPPGKPFGRSN